MTTVAYRALWIFIFAVPWEWLYTLPGVNIITKLTGGLALGLAIFAIVVSDGSGGGVSSRSRGSCSCCGPVSRCGSCRANRSR